jgi:hypothetical protein
VVHRRAVVRLFPTEHRFAFWFLLVVLLVVLFVVFFLAGHGGVSGGSS